jgi:uncharacterized protein YggE
MRSLILSCLFLLAAAPRARADSLDTVTPTVSATGSATERTRADRVELDLGVQIRAATSQEATTRAAAQANAIRAALQAAIRARGTVETLSYTVQPVYTNPQGGAAPTIAGYTATYLFRATLDEVDRAGEVLDAGTRAGANDVESVRFTLRDPDAPYLQALRAAAAEARSRADVLANAVGLRVNRVRSLVTSDFVPRPFFEAALAKLPDRTTPPIVPGMIETTANVTLTAEVRPVATGTAQRAAR